MTKLFVGNLPFSATEDAVRALFAAHGTVESLALITDRDTGRPRGFGFVEMSNADASRAMQALDGKDFEGRALKVNEAKAREGGGGIFCVVDNDQGALTVQDSVMQNNASGQFQDAPGIFDSLNGHDVQPTVVGSTIS